MDRVEVYYAGLHSLEIVVFVDLAPVYISLQAFFEDEVKPDAS